MTGFPPLGLLGHATVRLDMAGVRLLTDPVLRPRVGPLRRIVPAPTPALYQGTGVVLISHGHHDHLDLPSLRMLGTDVTVVVPVGLAPVLRTRGFSRVVELGVGATYHAGPVAVTATPAAHDGRRLPGVRAAAVGYTVVADGLRVYFAGDTDLFPEMTELGRDGVDVALLPVSGWGLTLGPGHLDPLRAAEAVVRLRPRLAVPIHWGTLAPLGAGRLMRHRLHQPPLDFAAAVAAAHPSTRVAVTAPVAAVACP